MKKLITLTLFIGFSCAHRPSETTIASFMARTPANKRSNTCMDAVRSILKVRREQDQVQLIDLAKQKVDEWKALESHGEITKIIGEDLNPRRKEMALLSLAILKQEFPQESLTSLGRRFKNLKKACTGP